MITVDIYKKVRRKMYQSDLLKKISRLNSVSREKKNYDQTLFPRVDKKKISVYKIFEDRYQYYPTNPYVDSAYWDANYTQDI